MLRRPCGTVIHFCYNMTDFTNGYLISAIQLSPFELKIVHCCGTLFAIKLMQSSSLQDSPHKIQNH